MNEYTRRRTGCNAQRAGTCGCINRTMASYPALLPAAIPRQGVPTQSIAMDMRLRHTILPQHGGCCCAAFSAMHSVAITEHGARRKNRLDPVLPGACAMLWVADAHRVLLPVEEICCLAISIRLDALHASKTAQQPRGAVHRITTNSANSSFVLRRLAVPRTVDRRSQFPW